MYTGLGFRQRVLSFHQLSGVRLINIKYAILTMFSRRAFLKGLGIGAAATLLPAEFILDSATNSLNLNLDLTNEAEAGSRKRKRKIRSTLQAAYEDTLDRKGGKDLETQIDYFVKLARKRSILSSNDKTSFLVHDLSNDSSIVDINGRTPHMAASLIKPFVMVAAYEKFHKAGSVDTTVKADIDIMIKYSSNSATNRVIDYVGGLKAVQKSIDSYSFNHHTQIVENIPRDGRTYKNKTSATDLAALLKNIHAGKIISTTASQEMMTILDGYHYSRISAMVMPLKGVKALAGKTGYVYGLNGESAIIDFEKNGTKMPFIFTSLVENTTKPYSKKREGYWATSTKNVISYAAKLAVHYYQR